MLFFDEGLEYSFILATQGEESDSEASTLDLVNDLPLQFQNAITES